MEVSVIFSNIKDEIIANLKKATTEIKLAVAWLTDEDIIRVLSQLQEKGISIQIIVCNSSENFKKTRQFTNLLRFGGGLCVASNPFMHHKFCIIDDKIILNGSYNWSYPAQRNNENLLIMLPDINHREDNLVILHFRAEFIKLYKRSTLIRSIVDLDVFRIDARNIAAIQATLEEWEINLRQEFESNVTESINISRDIGIQLFYTSLLDRMQSDGGGVYFVKRLINEEMQTGVMKPGFKKLEQHIEPRLDLSMEFLVALPQYEELFTKEEINFCRNLMRKYNLLHDGLL